jgi:cobalt-zinc-cadmium efflux system outer membrane protein
MSYRMAALAACLSLALAVPVSGIAREATAEPAVEEIDYPAAFERALAARPELRRFALQRAAQAARRDRDALGPPLEAGAELENAFGTGDLSGVGQAELTLSVGSRREARDKRAARVAVADEALAAIDGQERIAVLDLGAETARRFVALAGAQAREAQAARALDAATRVVEAVATRVRAAQSPKAESLNAGIQLASARLALGDAAREVAAARARLGEQWAQPDALPRATMDLFDLPQVADAATCEPRLLELPDVAQFASTQRLRDAEAHLAQVQARADWSWSVGVRRVEGLDDEALVLGFSVPLGSEARAGPGVAEARAGLALVDAEREATLLRLRTLLRTGLAGLESARVAEAVVREEQLPLAREAADLALAAYRSGRHAWRELALAQQQVLELERRRLESALAYHLARVEIERLVGSTLPPAVADAGTGSEIP